MYVPHGAKKDVSPHHKPQKKSLFIMCVSILKVRNLSFVVLSRFYLTNILRTDTK